jgi:CheY-like chemotaxis protein
VYLLDIGLPVLNGNELAAHLRGWPQAAGATRVAISGDGQDVDRRRTAAAGFDAHLTKPVDNEALIAVLSGPA